MPDPVKLLDYYSEEDKNNFFGRTEEIRRMLELAAENPLGNTLEEIGRMALTSNWPAARKLATHALAMMSLGGRAHSARMEFLNQCLQQTGSFAHLDYTLSMLSACGLKEDAPAIRDILKDGKKQPLLNAHTMNRMETIALTLETVPVEGRSLPGLRDFMDPQFITWRQSLGIYSFLMAL